jgi:hypothetical protein
VRTRYYENSEDAIVMWCHDVQSSTYRELLDEIAVRVNPCATDGSAS